MIDEDLKTENENVELSEPEKKRHHRSRNGQSSSSEENRGQIIAGSLVLGAGVYFLLDNLDLINISLGRIVMTWWPLAVIYAGIELLSRERPVLRTLWYIILVAALAYILMTGIFR